MNIYVSDLFKGEESFPKNSLQSFLENVLSTEKSNYSDYKIVNNLANADYSLLPLTWNFYIENRKLELAKKIYQEATIYNKRLLIFSTGDFIADVPFENVIIIQNSAFKSRIGNRGQKLLAIPTFITDYLDIYCSGKNLLRQKQSQPVVGFCGQANGSWLDFSRRQLSNKFKHLMFKLKLFKWEAPNIEPSLFRKRILQKIQQNPNISTNFILRTRYRAGYRLKVKDPFHFTRMEFINNILNTDYTVCIRGEGNFSVRFYEALSLGRIPVFVNTDCILPLADIINYKDYMVWVEPYEIPKISEKILDFHNSISENDFIDLQIECRNLWKNYLTEKGFFKNLPRVLV